MNKLSEGIGFLLISLMGVTFVFHFIGCSDVTSPVVPAGKGTATEDVTTVSIAKPGGHDKGDESGDYPQSGSAVIRFFKAQNIYRGGEIVLDNGSQFEVNQGALTPLPEIPWGEDVSITMTCDKDTRKNKLLFTFGPAGCEFYPSAKVILNWKDLDQASDSDTPVLFYIDKGNHYIPQTPDCIDFQGKWMRIYIDHFSRYAIAFTK